MELTPEPLRMLESWVRDARTDPQAESSLRNLIQRAGEVAPIGAVVELGESLLAIRRKDLRQAVEAN